MADQKRYAFSIRIIGVLKRDAPSMKMFMTSVLWSDKTEVIVYRSFQDFKKFHRQLKKRFPPENSFRSRDRVIPKFRAKAMKTKMQQKGSAKCMHLMRVLESYCFELLRCDPDVIQSPEVTAFFLPKDQDVQADFVKNSIVIMPSEEQAFGTSNAGGTRDHALHRLSMPDVTHPFLTKTYRCVAPYETRDTNNRPFKVALDERLDVLIKNPAGWWLVENEDKHLAWFPAPYLEMCEEEEDEDELEGIPLQGVLYCAARSYTANKFDELSVSIGVVVEVLRKSNDGWWLARYNGKVGYIPSMYLQPYVNLRAGLHSLQAKLHGSTLNLATPVYQSGNRFPSTLNGDYLSFPPQQDSTSPRATRIHKAQSLDVLSEGWSDRGPMAPVLRDERKVPLSVGRKGSLSGASSAGSDSSYSSSSSSSSSDHQGENLQMDPPVLPSSAQAGDSGGGRGGLSSGPPAPRVPPRPLAQEILTRCTTMTRKAALASSARILSLQEPIQTRQRGRGWT